MLPILLLSLDTDHERKKMTQIYDEHKNALFHAAFKITNNHQMAEDAVHNTFEQLIKKHKEEMFSLDFEGFRRRYIIIVKNKAIDLMRREKIYADSPIDDLDDTHESDELPVDMQIITQEGYAILRKHIDSLDEKSKAILEMKYILGMSYKEISEAVNLTSKNINMRITRAKAKVRKQMLEEGVRHV